MSARCRASVQLVRARWLLGGARRGHSACDAVRAARAARRAPRALGQRDAIFCKGIFGCAARGRFYAALFGRQRGNGVRMLCTRARWFWCKWRRTRGCAVVCRRSGQVSPGGGAQVRLRSGVVAPSPLCGERSRGQRADAAVLADGPRRGRGRAGQRAPAPCRVAFCESDSAGVR